MSNPDFYRLPRDEITTRKERLSSVEAELQTALDIYYRQAGWSADGVPTAETLQKLGLEWAAAAGEGE